jgi:hypothetical protein
MAEAKVAPVAEDKKIEPVEAKTEPKSDDKGEKEVKIGDALKTSDKKEPAEDKPRMVPEAVLIEYKKEAKAATKALEDLKKTIEDGATKKEVSKSIKDLAEKHNVDAEFLRDFADAVKKEAEAEVEEKVSARIKPITDKESADKVDKIFSEHFDKTLEAMPEYKAVVNKEVIKSLALDPKNANKTFAKIFEEAYGHLVTGKRTLETTKPRGGKDDTEIDFAKARKDAEYFKEIMSDPQLKKKYNEGIAERNNF